MASITSNVQRPVKLPVGGVTHAEIPLAGYANFGSDNTEFEVYHGSIMVCDVSDTDGYFRPMPATALVAMVSGDIFGGISQMSVKVTKHDTADGSKKTTVARDGVWGFPKGSIAQTDIGAAAYASDDGTITTTSTDALWVGYVEGVDDTYVWVNIAPAFMRANSPT